MRLYTCQNGLNLLKDNLSFWAWTAESEEYLKGESNRKPLEVPASAFTHSPGQTGYRIIDPELCEQIVEE